MNLKLITILLASLCFFSCSSSSDTTNSKFKIDYYTSGGIAGRSSGFTIYSNGKVDFWNGATITSRSITDSTNLNEEIVNKISELLQDSTVCSYNYQDKGNLTSVLKINSNDYTNNITYSGTVPPEKFPEQLKNLINELNKVSIKK